MGRFRGFPVDPPVRPAGAIFVLCLLLTATLTAQRGGVLNDPRPLQEVSTAYDANGGGVVLLTVFAQTNKARLDRQSVVKFFSQTTQTGTWQTTSDRSEAVFAGLPFGEYVVEVSAVGYLTAHKDVPVVNQRSPLQVEVVLQPDPAAIDLSVTDSAMPAKARKDAKHAVSALKSGDLGEAQKRLDEAYKLVPASPDLNFLLGYLYFQKKDFAHAGTYLSNAATLNPHNVQALSLLGRVGLERGDYPAAKSALEQAVAADSEYWLGHNLLADTYLRQHNYPRARDEAQLAIEKGGNGASPAQLVLAQALVALNRDPEAIQALNTFLQDSPQNPAASQVRNLIAQLEKRDSSPTQHGENTLKSAASLAGIDPLFALPSPGLSVTAWQPPSIDDVKPPLAAGVTCPSDKVIDASGERVKQLVDDVARFAAVEDLLHQRLDEVGNPIRTETRKFNYLATISESEPGFLNVDEFRADRLELAGYPDHIASTGFAALALVFHPHMRDNFEMTCEGLGGWRGQATWLVHFRQRDDRPNRMHSYKIGGQLYPVNLKGRAWITANNFQIVRIESEMVSPMPQIQLLSEHQIVEYGPIPFQKTSTALWLPKSAEIYFDFRRHRYYRRHTFDHYMLFSVDSGDNPKQPKTKPTDSPDSAQNR